MPLLTLLGVARPRSPFNTAVACLLAYKQEPSNNIAHRPSLCLLLMSNIILPLAHTALHETMRRKDAARTFPRRAFCECECGALLRVRFSSYTTLIMQSGNHIFRTKKFFVCCGLDFYN